MGLMRGDIWEYGKKGKFFTSLYGSNGRWE